MRPRVLIDDNVVHDVAESELALERPLAEALAGPPQTPLAASSSSPELHRVRISRRIFNAPSHATVLPKLRTGMRR
jgi:hypothetical protein